MVKGVQFGAKRIEGTVSLGQKFAAEELVTIIQSKADVRLSPLSWADNTLKVMTYLFGNRYQKLWLLHAVMPFQKSYAQQLWQVYGDYVKAKMCNAQFRSVNDLSPLWLFVGHFHDLGLINFVKNNHILFELLCSLDFSKQ